MMTSSAALTLDQAVLGQPYLIREVTGSSNAPELKNALEEIGFIAGERVVLMARVMPGGDPLAIRIGLSTFALRVAEAACVQIGSLQQDALS